MEENILHTSTYIIVLCTTILPVVAGVLCFVIPDRLRLLKGLFSLLITGIALFFGLKLFFNTSLVVKFNLLDIPLIKNITLDFQQSSINKYFTCNIDHLAKLVIAFSLFFTLLVVIYSLAYGKKFKKLPQFYSYILLTLGVSVLTVLANNLILFVFAWGFLGLTLYKIISPNDEVSSAAAKKTLIIVGASDGLMILGIGIIWKMSGSIEMSALKIPTDNALSIVAFLCLVIGAFTKAGAFPFHTWIPDYTESAPAPASAYLPASLDKLLGIYFLARICNDMFILNDWMRLVILILGVTTIIIAVMMALIQHNYKKLLGYHAVSQVGYMVTGIGLGSILGIVGGLFHMINNALYKSGLFLVAGSVKKSTGKDNLEDLGGLSKPMPITFFCALIFALSISGIPPLNGFASKWIIYQGIIDFGHGTGIANQLWIVWLALAVIGSALTLASFIKFISGVFLGRQKKEFDKLREVNWLMWVPQLVLAIACITFGVLASSWIVPKLFSPITGNIEYIGLWNSSAISLLILISMVLGVLVYFAFKANRFRTDDSFIGGETIRDKTEFPPTEFYETIKNSSFFKAFYKGAEKKWFDIYDLSKNVVLQISHLFSAAHNGILSNLAFWVLAGLIIMFIFLLI